MANPPRVFIETHMLILSRVVTNSIIENLNVKNTPVQGFSVNSATNLQLVRSQPLSGLVHDSDRC